MREGSKHGYLISGIKPPHFPTMRKSLHVEGMYEDLNRRSQVEDFELVNHITPSLWSFYQQIANYIKYPKMIIFEN